jgi:phosphatidylglycerol---prolipoprotein diacylglyceryl transferase
MERPTDSDSGEAPSTKDAPAGVQVAWVAPDAGPAGQLKPGDHIAKINGRAPSSLAEAQQLLAESPGVYEIETANGRIIRWRSAAKPARSAPVHPAQLYAAIDAALLALVLWNFYPFRRRDGEVIALLLTVHPISRFLLEMIRSDEPGQFGTELTISQWLSVAFLAVAVVLWWYIERQPRGSRLPLDTSHAGPSVEPA